MEENKLFTILKQMNIPVAYDHFTNKTVSIPFILYRNDSSDTFKADDKTYAKENSYIIDLVTEKKDVVLEKQLEDLLNDNFLPWDKEENYIDDERIYQIRFFI